MSKTHFHGGAYLVLAQYIEGMDGMMPSLFDERHLKAFGPYEPSFEARASGDLERCNRDVLEQFKSRYMINPMDAQRFFGTARVVCIERVISYDLQQEARQAFGELVRLPNPGRFSNVDYYFLRGDLE